MKSQILVKRYTLGLVNSVKDEAEFSALLRELSAFSELLHTHKDLKDALLNPFLPTSRKLQIAQDLLASAPTEKKAERCILLLVENDRLELLPQIIESLPDAWNEEKGVDTYEVASVVPLSDDQRKKLKAKLERLEKKPVILKYRIDPELVGGLMIKRKNIVYDISIKGSLLRLKEKIIEG
ncbi:MAG: ATP synthase F1 subunit delta [Candidatus Aminicenantes bacterium]|nr:MAG: ATP synthase F1 subunit delta [Candidatus Aminicenantes bacterium]